MFRPMLLLRGFFPVQLVGWTLALAVILSGSTAWADNKTAARTSAVAGIADYEAGRFAEALARFEKAEEFLHAPPHLLYIARCRVKLGKLVDAREAYLSLINETLASNAPAAFVEAQQTARTENAELEPRIPRLTVNVEGGDDAELILNGANVGGGLVGLPYPIDPGRHSVKVVTGNAASEEQSVEVLEGATVAVTLTLVQKGSNGTQETPLLQTQTEGDAASVPAEPRKSSLRPALIYGGFGLGLVGVGVGSVTGLLALGQVKSVKEDFDCDEDGVCDSATSAESKEALKPARTLETVSTIGFVAGAVGIGIGLVGFLLRDPERETAHRPSHRVMPLLGAVNGVALLGEF